MSKETSNRSSELKELGWSNDDVSRYIELWEYRQRWGAINLEREDRQFLRKAESALPKLVTTKISVKKPIREKSYYRWLNFYLTSMQQAEKDFQLEQDKYGAWPIILEEELRLIDYYQPVLGLPDTLKAKGFDPIREKFINSLLEESSDNIEIRKFDFQRPLDDLKNRESTSWRQLRESAVSEDQVYPILGSQAMQSFRKTVRAEFTSLILNTLPSLADTEKTLPSDNWTAN